MKKKNHDFVSVLIVIAGILALAYPFISNYLLEKNSSKAVRSYEQAVEALGDEKIRQMLEDASIYNQQLVQANGFEIPSTAITESKELTDTYWKILDVDGSGMMGYLTVPRLKETLPIYHGTAEEVLQVGVGHLEYTSFPVGGTSTHAALSGHRGLTSAKLFTDLDQVKIGDKFFLRILNEKIAYQVDKIVTVKPEEMEELSIKEGEDYVTLITCTPYGINTHRLLVRGTRIPYVEEAVEQETEKQTFFISRQYLYPLIGVAILLVFLLLRKIFMRISKRKG